MLLLVATAAFSQAKKPTIMVVPSKSICVEKGFTVQFEQDGYSTTHPDYERAVLDGDIRLVVAKIGEMMAERGFPLERLDATMDNIKTSEARLANMTNREGDVAQMSPLEQIMNTARPDIRLEIYYKLNVTGPRKSVTFEMSGIDAYTNVQVASASGTGAQSFSTEVPLMLQAAVLDYIDQFCNQLQMHFDDLLTNGREVSVEFRCAENTEFDFYTSVDGNDLCDILEDVIYDNTVGGRYNLQTQDDRVLGFTRVRIPIYNDRGRPLDARRWAVNVVREVKRSLQVNPDDNSSAAAMKLPVDPKVQSLGLGRVQIMF